MTETILLNRNRQNEQANRAALNGVYPAETCVTRYALEKHARERPDQIYAVFEDGQQWSFQETLQQARAIASGLKAVGVRQGDHVLLALPNGALALKALIAINYLGAVSVPINPALKGSLLEHVIHDSGASVAIVHEKLIYGFATFASTALKAVISSGAVSNTPAQNDRLILPVQQLYGAADDDFTLEFPIEPWHTQCIIYTSGTTGRSKGVQASYMHGYSMANVDTWTCTRVSDRHLLHMPFFHIGGTFLSMMCLCQGGSVAVVESFKTDTFWHTVRTMEVTVVFLLGAMATFLLKAPPGEDDKNHHLRMVFIVPLGKSGPEFGERFGVEVYTLFNMTETSTPLLSGVNPQKPNTCGRVREGVEVRLVDANDCEVPVGSVGEMIVRSQRPWSMNHGYLNNPQATADAWRNGWFHTGDAFYRDEEGNFFFVDRMKDAIRRRGENISSYEIEIEVLSHPAVREVAAVGVPSEYTEDEVMIVVAAVQDHTLDPVSLIEHLRPRVAHYMVPRYIRILPELPKTPTAKVQKHLLRAEGVTPDTWDCRQAGLTWQRESFT
ncbi:MAG TPA: AMP-binding protein [Burkholderiaceae bacterium]|nr:AMP-binding protein [Burkholderiaceae bacterium]